MTSHPAGCGECSAPVLWAFTARDLYRLLVVERKWTPLRYQQWLADALVDALMKKAPRKSRRVAPLQTG